MVSPAQGWHPEWTVSPGEILAEELEVRGLSQSELARRMGRPIKTINEIVNAKAAITADTALQLEMALGISSRLWLNLEADYRGALARERVVESLGEHESWAKRFPLKDLRKYGLLDATAHGGEMVTGVLGYFGVGSVDAWTQRWSDPVALYRHSPSFESDSLALAAWLRWGERIAESVQTKPFDRQKLQIVLAHARGLTSEEPLSDVLDELSEMLANCGVVLALTPSFSGTRASGAARWLSPNRALIQLSMRYSSDDHLWFSFFHEAAHLLDAKRDAFLDEEPDAEDRANSAARSLLIPDAAYSRFVKDGRFDEASVRAFAQGEGIAPGIVVGRLQNDDHLGRSKLNHLKKRLTWAHA